MTDTELKRRKAICEVANVSDIGDLSDGFHTFNGLYYQRMILFASLVRAYKDRAWKSYCHEDGEPCFGGGWFIVGIDTPEGSYTYHYENKDFDRFDCVELPCGKHWDGHNEDDVTRLLSLPTVSPDDARGVVHCCHCIRAEPREPVGIKTEIFCRLLCAGMRKDDYCSYGKLRTNGAAHMEGNDDGTLDNP